MEYIVKASDSIERIAAVHDCTVGELMKMNRLGTRMVFPGQKLIVPLPMNDEETFDNSSATSQLIDHAKTADGIPCGPGTAVQVQGRMPDFSLSTALREHCRSRAYSERTAPIDSEVDTDCSKRFIKLKVKHITEANGTVTGTLIITPNALMFDPDVVHPLVMENGQDLYIVMVRAEEIMSVTMFKDVSSKMDDPTNQLASLPECSETHVASNTDSQMNTKERSELNEVDICEIRNARRTYSDSSSDIKQIVNDKKIGNDSEKESPTSDFDRIQAKYFAEPSTSENDACAKPSTGPFSRLGRTLSFHANTIRGSVTWGAERMTQSAVSGTKSVAQGVVSQSKAVADSLQSSIHSTAKVAASHAKTAVDAVVAMPQGITGIGTGLFSVAPHQLEEPFPQDEASPKTEKEQNIAILLALKEKTQQLRMKALENKNSTQPIHELLSTTQISSTLQKSTTVESPFYLSVHLHKKKKCDEKKSSVTTELSPLNEDVVVGYQARTKFWFTVPKEKVDAIYQFLLLWNPEKFVDPQEKDTDNAMSRQLRDLLEDPGFVAIGAENPGLISGWFLYDSFRKFTRYFQ